MKIINTLIISRIDQLRGYFKNEIFSNTVASILVRITRLLLNFGSSLLLARLLSKTELGVYFNVITLVSFLVIIARVGLPALLVREIAACKAQHDYSSIKALLSFSNIFVVVSSLVVCTFAAGWMISTQKTGNYESALPYLIGFSLITLDALRSVRLSAMQGLGKVALGQFPDSIISPMLLMGSATILYFCFDNYLNASWLLVSQFISLLVSLALGVYLLQINLPRQLKKIQPQYQIKYWLKSSIPLGFLDLSQNTNRRIDVVMLASLLGPSSVASYFIIDRLVFLVRFILASINTNIAPAISGDFASGNLERLQKIISKSTQISCLSATAVSIFFMVFGHWVLLLFGESYTVDFNALRLFSLVQLTQAIVGPVGILLSMTGNARFTSAITLAVIPIKIILNYLLIPRFGLEGSAIAAIVCVVFSSFAAWLFVKSRTGINTLEMYQKIFNLRIRNN